jgi:hypothetical protein
MDAHFCYGIFDLRIKYNVKKGTLLLMYQGKETRHVITDTLAGYKMIDAFLHDLLAKERTDVYRVILANIREIVGNWTNTSYWNDYENGSGR